MFKSALAGTAVLFGLWGCASANGPQYADFKAKAAPSDPTSARLVIYRPSAGMMGAARSARVTINKQESRSCDTNGFVVSDQAPGALTVKVDLPDTPGACQLTMQAEASKEYFFEIKPRSATITSGLLLGTLGQIIESSGKTCGGAFEIEQVSVEKAAQALPQMRLSL